MAKQSQLDRYGAISRAIPELAPSAKVFLVGDSDDTTYGIQNLAAEYPPDGDGVVRVYSTIQAAVNAAAANRGDVVLVAPNHVEDHQRADTWATAGVQIIGMGNGEQRAGLTYNAAGSTVHLRASGMRVSNLMFLASFDSQTAGLAALNMDTGFYGQRVDHCMFTYDGALDDFRTHIRLGAKESVIEDNQLNATDTVGCHRGIQIVGGDPDHSVIRRNYIYGNFDSIGGASDSSADGNIALDTTNAGSTELNGLLIHDNILINVDSEARLINLGTGVVVRGVAANNILAAPLDTSSADTLNAVFAGLTAVNNHIVGGDSDIREGIVGTWHTVRVFDSG